MKKLLLLIALLATTSSLYAGKGKIRIACDKEGAYIYVDGKKKAMTGEGFTSILLEEGEHMVRVEKVDSGYIPTGDWILQEEKNIFVGEDTSTKLSFSLIKIRVRDVKSIKEYKIQCSKENAQICTKLGNKYISGREARNFKEALKYYKRGCEGNDNRGCSNVAYMYENGFGVKKNYKKARNLRKKRCKNGDFSECSKLGNIYKNGDGVKKSYDKALQFYKQGCDGGNSDGCTSLGLMYKNGFGVKKNYKKALKLYNKACDMGNDFACNLQETWTKK